MTIKSLNQKGVSAVEGLLVVLIVAVVAGTGYYVYTANKNANDTYKSANNSSTPKYSSKKTVEDTHYSKVPGDLQVAILAAYKEDVPACVKDSKLVDEQGQALDPPVRYDTRGFAEAAVGCDGGSAHLFVKVQGNWKDVQKTQSGYSCETLKQYSVPVYKGHLKLVDDCWNSDADPKQVPYTG